MNLSQSPIKTRLLLAVVLSPWYKNGSRKQLQGAEMKRGKYEMIIM
jgi:hypothetical protein